MTLSALTIRLVLSVYPHIGRAKSNLYFFQFLQTQFYINFDYSTKVPT
jgi:hypothetical protein